MGITAGSTRSASSHRQKVGSRVRVRSVLTERDEGRRDSTVQLTVQHTVELEGGAKPAAVAEMIGVGTSSDGSVHDGGEHRHGRSLVVTLLSLPCALAGLILATTSGADGDAVARGRSRTAFSALF